MEAQNPDYKAYVQKVFSMAPFIGELGIQVQDIQPGYVETVLDLQKKHLQQDGLVHAGVLATMVDHTCGGAGTSLIQENEYVLSLEFKINFLRPAKGESLHCQARVTKPSKKFIFVEGDIFCVGSKETKLVSKAMVTLAVLKGEVS